MEYKQLFLFVEGDDDERFFKEIINPKFKEEYNSVTILKYANLKIDKVNKFIQSIKSMGAEYIFVSDINSSPCVTDKKQRIQSKFHNIDINKIMVIVREIESWYLAGLDKQNLDELKISFSGATNNINKEIFHKLIPNRFDSRVDFMIEILNRFSIETAKKNNNSFKYFLNKFFSKI